MPSTSKAQQKAAGAALSAKRGILPKSKLQGASKDMYESMTWLPQLAKVCPSTSNYELLTTMPFRSARISSM
jgi:Protein of unknwon function (DUF3008)